jgi:hypothetical protein
MYLSRVAGFRLLFYRGLAIQYQFDGYALGALVLRIDFQLPVGYKDHDQRQSYLERYRHPFVESRDYFSAHHSYSVKLSILAK